MFENCVSSHQRLSSSLYPNVDSFPLVKSRSKLFSIDCWEVGKTLNSFNTIPLNITIWLHRRDAIRLQKKSHGKSYRSANFQNIRSEHLLKMPSFESSIKAKKTKNPNKYKRWRPSVSNSVGLMTLDKPLPECKGNVKQLLRTNYKTLMKTAFPLATCQLCLHELTSVSSFALAISFSLTCITRYTSLRISLLQDITSLRRNSATRNRSEPL